jgi:hypothetical protein
VVIVFVEEMGVVGRKLNNGKTKQENITHSLEETNGMQRANE